MKSIDPYCGMTVSSESKVFTEYQGTKYYFCCDGCKDEFLKDPVTVLKKGAPHLFFSNVQHSDCAEKKGGEPIFRHSRAEIHLFTCPMHPEVEKKGAGSCPICGMALEPLEVQLEQGPSAELQTMLKRFYFAAILSFPLLALTMTVGLSPWIQWGLATPVVFWSGFPLWVLGFQSIKNRNLNMFTLILLGTFASYFFSVFVLLFPHWLPGNSHDLSMSVYFEASAVITTLVLLGQVLELKARAQTGSAIQGLLKLAPNSARKINMDGSEVDVSIETIQIGDRVRIRPGERIPIDGIIQEGQTSIDESMITGESMPVEKVMNDKVIAGTINGNGTLIIQTQKVGADTLLSQIVKKVSEAQRTRAPIQRYADQVSAYFVPLVVLVSICTAVIWYFFGPEPKIAYALVNAVAVLIIACPCALGLATPMSIMVGTGMGAKAGILVRNAEALELLEKVDTLLIDKTGTVTQGKPKLVSVISLQESADKFSPDEILKIAASLEKGSEHPLAGAILQGAKEQGISLDTVIDFESISGKGIRGVIQSKKYFLGKPRNKSAQLDSLLNDGNTVIELTLESKAIDHVDDQGHDQVLGLIAVADPIKPGSIEAISELKKLGIRLVMLTGDHSITADAIATKVGIDEWHADVLPDQKMEVVKSFQKEGKVIGMVGDGINDAPALAQAQVGIAMGTGTDVAIQSASVTIMNGDLLNLVKALKLSQKTMSNVRQNLFFAFFYNFLGVPLAAGLLYPFFGASALLSPMVASAAMSFSSVSVIANALRLRQQSLS